MKRYVVLMLCTLSACSGKQNDSANQSERESANAAESLPKVSFTDVSAQAGVDFTHFSGATEQFYFPEIMGSGVALFDYDNDGDLDLYAIQGAVIEAGRNPEDSRTGWRGVSVPVNRLFRNELVPEGNLRFTDVTEQAKLGDASNGMGVAVGDVDNDGDADVFVSNVGVNTFYVNNGSGVFASVPDVFPGSGNEWTTSASFLDYDHDGDLDLFTTNYVGFGLDNNIECTGNKGKREYCSPNVYPPTVDRLWRNDGERQFVDVTRESGIGGAAGNGLGVTATDFDQDGRIDIYVANDMEANRLWLQTEEGRFSDTALMSGSAYNAKGEPEASMGVTAGDFDGDGDDDLFMTHLNGETNTLYENTGRGNFIDRTRQANLAASSMRLTGFGTGWLDFDNDGLLDLFIANGAVIALSDPEVEAQFPYGQLNQLLRNEQKRFRETTSEAGKVFALKEIGRGASFGDLDNDGDTDIVVSNNSGPLRVLLNEAGHNNDWLSIKLVGTDSPRDGTGTRLKLGFDNGTSLFRRAHSDGSYLSASDTRVQFGLGQGQRVESVTAYWTSGREEVWDEQMLSLKSNQQIELVEGTGRPL